ncbi:hypothetical protein [Rhizobium sp. L1K21]|uniref:hypothetical protein n=1 Tax=Rhizobium sp. L1K21 TaxID=2954933 RepID=UPI002092A662|nr:hypothetical protein [Rhizobium sp. L1K21]MCO6185232.1 hypothetical protein [Rhizobium sp. L1K21]
MMVTPPKIPYPGDEAFAAFLEKYDCPMTLQSVKFRMWGQITTIALGVSPIQEIKSMWDDEFPEFEGEDAPNDFLGMIMSLWNTLAQMNMEGKRLNLSQRTGLGDIEGLKQMVERRLDELDDGFLCGFVADMRGFDAGDLAVDKALSKISDMIEELEFIEEELEETPALYDKMRTRFVRLDGKAQQRLDAVVKAANVARGVSARTAGIH